MGRLGLALLAFVLFSPAYVYAAPGNITVDLEGTSYDVNYDAEGVQILSAVTDLDFISLLLEVEVTGTPGILEITLDRSFFDSTFQGVDESFIVIADGDEPDVEEIETTSQSRTLRIELPLGTEDVEIIGTEFGSQIIIEEPELPEEPEAPPKEPEEPPEEPTACTLEYAPVCGVDGITYGNMCMLDAAGIELDYSGECVTEETPSGPKVQCGPGTVLKDGVCILEEKCGLGTILQDGICVPTGGGSTSISRDFIVGGGAALVIAFIVIIIFAAIARASRTKNN